MTKTITQFGAISSVATDDEILIWDTSTSLTRKVTVTNFGAIYPLLAGRSGGQTIYGGTAANDDLTLDGTSHATKTTSYVFLQPSGGIVAIGGGNAATYVDIAGTRAYVGYDGGNALVLQGGASKGINFCTNNATFGSGVVMSLTSTGVLDVVSTVRTSTLYVDGDAGGAAGTNTLTNVSDVTANSTGVGTIKFKGATSRDSAGFIKIYSGTTAYYVPAFSAITG